MAAKILFCFKIKTRILYWFEFFVTLVFMSYAIVTLHSTFEARSNIKKSDQMEDFALNFKQPYITDIRMIEGDCVESEESLFSYQWKGVSDYCNCDGSIHDGECSGGVYSTCDYYDAIDVELNFTKFLIQKNSQTKVSLCIKRSPKPYIEILKDQKGECSSSQKTCGNPQFPESIICVESNESCPIYQIVLYQQEDQAKSSDPNWGLIKYGSSFLYYDKVGKQTNSPPISQLIVGLSNKKPCEYTYINNIFSTKVENINEETEDCDPFNDWIYTNLEMSRQDFYKINLSSTNYYDKLMDLDDFVENQNGGQVNVGVYYRPYFKWSINQRANSEQLIESITDMDDIVSLLDKKKVFELVIAIVFEFIIPLWMTFKLVLVYSEWKEYFNSEGEKVLVKYDIKLLLVLSLIKLAVSIPLFVFSIQSFLAAMQKRYDFEEYSNSNPSSENVNQSIDYYQDMIMSLTQNGYISLIFACKIILLPFIQTITCTYNLAMAEDFSSSSPIYELPDPECLFCCCK